ncbi:MAG TPA: protein kinase [Vicinamibacterales bacterium]|nr:protein kinase [Vicinamibacterales bacterium]
MPAAARTRFLDDACRGDSGLRAEVEALLAHRDTGFLEESLPAAILGPFANRATGSMLTPGTRVLTYDVRAPLGAGGMGEVYLAHDIKLDRDVAIKVLPVAFAAQPERRARFEREARALAALNHPNIVTVYSVEQADDTMFLTMEFVDGRRLDDVLTKQRLPLVRLLRIVRQIVEAVVAAHERGIVHRDLKPANVMIASGDRAKVLDFGLARLRETADEARTGVGDLTAQGVIVGTVAYMSPEQAEGKPADERADIFSIGVLLYEMSTGERPFKGDTHASLLASILRDTPASVLDLNRAVPRDLARIIRRCLVKDPDRRYQSAKDLRNDLDELAHAMDSGELMPESAGAPPPRARISLGVVTGVVAASLVVMATAVWLRGGRQQAATSPSIAAVTRVTQSEGIEQFPSLSRDGNWIVYARNGDIFLQSTSGQTAINLTNDAAARNTMPAFSPDGESIVFRSERDGGGLLVMGRTGEARRRLTTKGFNPSWFPDGRRIVFGVGEATFRPDGRRFFSDLWIVDASGGEPRLLFPGDAVQPQVSPHSQRIAYWAIPSNPVTRQFTGSQREIWTVRIDGTRPVRVVGDAAYNWNPVWAPDGKWLYFLSSRSGSMNLWRVAINEATGEAIGAPQPVGLPSPYVSLFTIGADGVTFAYQSLLDMRTIERIGFDGPSGRVFGEPVVVAAPSREFFGFDLSHDGHSLVASTRFYRDLFVVSVDSGEVRQLTHDVARARAPRWSADDRRVYFFSDLSGGAAVWSIGVDGSGLTEFTASTNCPNCNNPTPAPDGAMIAANDNTDGRVFLFDAHNATMLPEALAPFPSTKQAPTPAGWSPDAKMLAIVAADAVWVYARDTGSYRRIADQRQVVDFSAAWLNDGKRFVYESEGKLLIVDVFTGAKSEILSPAGNAPNATFISEGMFNPRLSPDGTQLFFQHAKFDSDIWLARFSEPR